jgi:hypothetical protein
MHILPRCARVWPLLCLIGLLAGCRAERIAFKFQPARSTIRPDSTVLVPPPSPSVSKHPEESPIAKRVARSARTPVQQPTPTSGLRKKRREMARASFRGYRTHRSQRIARHKGYRVPADALSGLPRFVGMIGLVFLGLCIVGIVTGSVGLAIAAGIVAALLFVFALVLSGD